MKKALLALSLGLFAFGPAQADHHEEAPIKEVKAPNTLLQAIDLPKATEAAREAGVADAEIGAALDAARAKEVPAGEMTSVIGETAKAAREHGNVDNFGAFVKSKLEEGLRGKELAMAIRAEHEAKGVKKDKPAQAGKDGEHGKPEGVGKDAAHGGKGAASGGGTGGGKGDGSGKGNSKGNNKGADKAKDH